MPFAVPVVSLTRLWRRAATSHTLRLAAICAVFAALLATGFHSGRDFAGMLQVAFTQSNARLGAAARQNPNGAVLPNSDPTGEFVSSRVGQLLFSNRRDDDCLRVMFNNRTGAMSEAGSVACGVLVEAAADPALDRAEVLRRAFRK